MSRSPVPLRELQRELQRHLLGEDNAISEAIVDAPPLPALERLAIYKNAYRVRLIDALHETYPVLHGLLGDEAWVALGESFVAAHPSPYRSIRWYGRELAEFMTCTSPFDASPILSEVAILEWTLSEVFDAEEPFTPRGCVAQAWSVAEVLRCWVKTAPESDRQSQAQDRHTIEGSALIAPGTAVA